MTIDWDALAKAAEAARENALLAPGEKTRVGCAAVNEHGRMAAGCNIQHKFRCDIHAEVAALAGLWSSSPGRVVAILVVAERENFTPCGACLDWIFELGGPDCVVGFQSSVKRETCAASALMPRYPH